LNFFKKVLFPFFLIALKSYNFSQFVLEMRLGPSMGEQKLVFFQIPCPPYFEQWVATTKLILANFLTLAPLILRKRFENIGESAKPFSDKF